MDGPDAPQDSSAVLPYAQAEAAPTPAPTSDAISSEEGIETAASASQQSKGVAVALLPSEAEVGATNQTVDAAPDSTADTQTPEALASFQQNAAAVPQADAPGSPSVEDADTVAPATASAAAAADSQLNTPSLPDAALPDAAAVGSAVQSPVSEDAQGLQGPLQAFANTTFTVPTEKWQHQQSVPLGTTAAEIKHSLCSNWNIPETALSVKHAGRELKDSESLSSCGIQVHICIDTASIALRSLPLALFKLK